MPFLDHSIHVLNTKLPLARLMIAAVLTILSSQALAASGGEVATVRTAQRSAYVLTASTNGCPRTEEYAADWSGAVIVYCEYRLRDRRLGRSRPAIAYLLDIPPARLAAWIDDACRQLVSERADCFEKMLTSAKLNSSLIFPVAGNILEDMDRPGYYRNYIFQNGMTVAPNLTVNGSEADLPVSAQRKLIRYPPDRLAGIKTGMTRFWGTVPSQIAARFPDLKPPARLNVGDGNARWLNMVRQEMLSSLDSDRNRLVEAYLCANAQTMFGSSCKEASP